MFHYVRGLLELNQHGACAPGSSIPVDRWLVISTLEGMSIRVFDYTYLPNEGVLLSEREAIKEGKTYTFLLTVLAYTLEKCEKGTDPLAGDELWQGTVVDPQWVLPQKEYLTVDPQDVGSYYGVLVETKIGQLIINRERFKVNERGKKLRHPLRCRPGDVLRWDHIRLNLLAILA